MKINRPQQFQTINIHIESQQELDAIINYLSIGLMGYEPGIVTIETGTSRQIITNMIKKLTNVSK